jgi:hypothetical protein
MAPLGLVARAQQAELWRLQEAALVEEARLRAAAERRDAEQSGRAEQALAVAEGLAARIAHEQQE